MTAHRPTLTTGQVAGELGRTRDWFYRNRRRLEDDHGFPPPLAGSNGRRWDIKAINAWKDAQMPNHLKPLPDVPVLDLKVKLDPEDYAEGLDARADALARGDLEGR